MGNSDPPGGMRSTGQGGASSTLKPRTKKGKKDRTKEAIVLIPLTYNDGSEIDPRLHDECREQVFVEFGGWTVEGTVVGAYEMASGERRIEHSLKVSIFLQESQLPILETIVGQWADVFQQESLVLKITDYVVKLIPPLKREEGP